MLQFNKPGEIIITCPNRMSAYLAQEVEALGFVLREVFATGVKIEGTLADCMKLNLNVRTGNQVLFLLKSFKVNKTEELYIELVNIPWENYIAADGYFTITCNVDTPAITNTMFANVKVKDAIVDRIKEKMGVRPDSGSAKDKAVVHLFWKEEDASIYIDTTGETLSRHEYRKIPGLAPMQENLAAAVVMATGYTGDGNFLNPMCGSGTLAIEAAMIALNKPWAIFRKNFSFMHFIGYDEKVYEALKNDLFAKIKTGIKGKIIASDISERALEGARINAEIAGVKEYIQFEKCDFSESTVPEGSGVVLMNPEYGERLGEEEDLVPVYKAMGDFMKRRCKGYTGYIFTGSPDLAKVVGLKASKKIEFYNSKIDCRLLKYELYDGSKREPKKEASDL